MDKLNGCIFWLTMVAYWKNLVLFGIKSVQAIKNNLIANLSTIKFFKTKIKSYGVRGKDLHDKEITKAGYNHTCLAVTAIESAL